MIDAAIVELQPLVGVRAACRATGRGQASHYRRHRQSACGVPILSQAPDLRILRVGLAKAS
jgi:hypothetical protein